MLFRSPPAPASPCPPSSSVSSVYTHTPPTTPASPGDLGRACSKMVTAWPARVSSRAVARPAAPAPMTAWKGEGEKKKDERGKGRGLRVGGAVRAPSPSPLLAAQLTTSRRRGTAMAAAGRSGVVADVRALASPDGRVRGALGMGGLGQASPVFAPLLFSTLLILGNDLPPFPRPRHAAPLPRPPADLRAGHDDRRAGGQELVSAR